jgi:hypothetical protein
MPPHKDTKYSVNSRLNDHDAQLLELRGIVKSFKLSPGPQGNPGATGASGADGRNGNDGRPGRDGKDSCVPGPAGPVGLQGHRGERGVKGDTGAPGKDGKSIIGPAGPKGDKGERGDITVYGPEELQVAVKAMRTKLVEQHARVLAALDKAMDDAGRSNEGTKRMLQNQIANIRRDAGL